MNGKGSRPRNNFSSKFRDNFDSIVWRKKPSYLERLEKSAEDFCVKNGDALLEDFTHYHCACRRCNPDAWWMVVCPRCGNKRCPHASNHLFACTSSNEPGQKGSDYA